jgi:hypothetical protein
MCFTEDQSYFNFILCTATAIYVYPKYQLSMLLIFLGLKELIQGLLYYYQNSEKAKNILTSFAWIHICFQPLFVNIFFSYFSQNQNKFWHIIFLISFIYGIYSITLLNEFDIQNDPDCILTNNNDYCSLKTTSYIGKYHIGYKFNKDYSIIVFPIMYLILLFIPTLFTNSKILGMYHIIFVLLIHVYFNDIRNGEMAAIWCFLSIIFFIPLSLFNKQVLKYLK